MAAYETAKERAGASRNTLFFFAPHLVSLAFARRDQHVTLQGAVDISPWNVAKRQNSYDRILLAVGAGHANIHSS